MKLLTVFMSALISVFAKAPATVEIDKDELPQSVVFDIVMDHFNDNKNELHKKLLFIGYDGFRRDCLPIITADENGAVSRVITDGSLLFTYAGGTKGAEQQTSTAVGWCSILTGKMAAESGVWNNKSVKRDSAETFLTKASDLGYSCAFISSYHSHFDSTFVRDIRTAKETDASCDYIRTVNDRESLDVAKSLLLKDSYDVIVVIFEYTDDAGHAEGFSIDEPSYADACRKADRAGAELIDTALSVDGGKSDRLFVITTDHGGIGRRHGGQTPDERLTWAVVGK